MEGDGFAFPSSHLQRDRQEWFPVLLFSEKIKRILLEERKPLGISLSVFRSGVSFCLLLHSLVSFSQAELLPGSYILFYHSLCPYPFLVLSSSLILFALILQEFLSLFTSFPSFFLCFRISVFIAHVQAILCCRIARNKLPLILS